MWCLWRRRDARITCVQQQQQHIIKLFKSGKKVEIKDKRDMSRVNSSYIDFWMEICLFCGSSVNLFSIILFNLRSPFCQTFHWDNLLNVWRNFHEGLLEVVLIVGTIKHLQVWLSLVYINAWTSAEYTVL